MPAAITTLRGTIAAALADSSYAVFSYPPATPVVNAVIITPADPYLEPNNNTYSTISPMANFRLTITTPMLDNQGNLNSIEERVVTVFNKLAASSLKFNVGSVSAPSVMTAVSGDLLEISLNISILTSWS